jgi:hypothetical protein
MEAVQAEPDRRMVGQLDDPPRPPVVVDEAAPRQGFEGHLDVESLRQVTEPAQLVREDVVGVDGSGRDVAAHEDLPDAEAMCGHEGGFGATEVVGERLLVDTLDIAQRLI